MIQVRTRFCIWIGVFLCVTQAAALGQCVLDDGDSNSTVTSTAFDDLRDMFLDGLLPANPTDDQLMMAGFCVGDVVDPGGCGEEEISFSDSYAGCPPLGPGDVNGIPQSVFLPKFDSNLGQLRRVELLASTRVTDVTALLENTNPIAECVWNNFVFSLAIQVDNPTVFGGQLFTLEETLGMCSSSDANLGTAGQYDGTMDFAGLSFLSFECETGDGDVMDPNLKAACFEGPDVQDFVGVCPAYAQPNSCTNGANCDCLEYPIFSVSTSVFDTTCNNFITDVRSNIEVVLTVRYTYLPNQQPQGLADCGEVCEREGPARSSMVFIDVLQNDFDLDGMLDCNSITIAQNPANGVAMPVANGCNNAGGDCPNNCIRYIPNVGFTGTDSFTYTVEDTDGCISDPINVTIYVYANPNANPDSYTTCRNMPIVLSPLANDNDSDNRGMGSCMMRNNMAGQLDCDSFFVLAGPTNGTLGPLQNCGDCGSNCANCSVLYTPNAGFVGTDSFTYRIMNCTGCFDETTVTIEVCQPITQPDRDLKTCEGEPLNTIDVLANDMGSVCSPLDCASLIVNPGSFSAGGTAFPSGCDGNQGSPECANCFLVYTPAPDFFGVETFTYQVADRNGCLSDPTLVTVTVYPKPELSKVAVDLDPLVDTEIIIDLVAEGALQPGPGCVLDLTSIMISNDADQGTVENLGNGVFRYTPGPDFEQDQFCYTIQNICDGMVDCPCIEEQCVNINLVEPCPCINRREPGSLLLFPEYDNRGLGFKTWFTITNTNRSSNTGAVKVEFVFREETNCLEDNLTIDLTAADTLSAITCDFVPSTTRGYFYAFAKDNAGNPISFNHLTGQVFGIDAFATCEWSVNAVSFKSPQEQGAFTNLDMDTVRDLDGMEYVEAPDEILIPRFIANDPFDDGGFLSYLILINLSGGRQFTTTLDFAFFNDNEEPFSREYTFTCWAKPTLEEISSQFLQQNLVLTMQDPEEPFGDRTRETGWIRIDGQIAQSTVESIVDPAFYAVLIEHDRMSTAAAADLPWEYCVQDNGDLLPFSILGDGPNFSDSDNE